MKFQVNSEIGRLKSVLVHRPGKEVERLYPEVFERLLFDDIMYLKNAQSEHDEFVQKLRDEDIEVLYVEQLVADVLDEDNLLREILIRNFIKEAKIESPILTETIFKFWNKITDNLELVKALIAGIEKEEITLEISRSSLVDLAKKYDQYPFYIDPIPNILFQRDPIASVYDSISINQMWSVTRRREKIFYDYILKYHPKFETAKPIIYNSEKESVEGGDILVINKETIFVGLSQRTNAQAIETLAKELFKRYHDFKRLIAIEIPKSHSTMHLDTVMTQMDHDKFSIDPKIINIQYTMYELTMPKNELVINKNIGLIGDMLKKYVHKNIKLFTIAGGSAVASKGEQWNDGAICLPIRPGVIVVYNRNTVTNNSLRKAGIKLIEVPSGELSRGRGGPRCMSMPLFREEL